MQKLFCLLVFVVLAGAIGFCRLLLIKICWLERSLSAPFISLPGKLFCVKYASSYEFALLQIFETCPD